MVQTAAVTDNIDRLTGNVTESRRQIDSNYQDFLKLLTVQLQNQDPTEPTDTNALTEQIATLSQVEQQLATNENLERLITLFNATQYNSVVSYIGKQIEAEGSVGALKDGQGRFAYYLEREAAEVTVTISDGAGNAVYQTTGPVKAGRNEFIWDGKDQQGNQLADGTYSIAVEAKDGGKNSILSKTYVTGVVSSVDSSPDGTVYLSIADEISVPVERVISIRQSPNQNQS